MKILIAILMFVAFGSYAEDTSDITNKVVETKDKDGKVISRDETTYRGKTAVMEVHSSLNKHGVLVVDYSSYSGGGDLFMVEYKGDKNTNGGFMLIRPSLNIGTNQALLGTNQILHEIEMFNRQPDGSVKPVDTQTLKEYQSFVTLSEIWQSDNYIKDTILSPDQTLKAVVFESDCGAPCGFDRQVVILKNSEELPKHDHPNSFFCIAADGKAAEFLSKLKVTWVSTNELHIKYPVGSDLNVLRTNSPDQPIKVTYEHFRVWWP